MVILSVYLLNDLHDNERIRDWMVSLYGSYSFRYMDGKIQTFYIEPWHSWLDKGADELGLESLQLWRAIGHLRGKDRGIQQISTFLSPNFEVNLGNTWRLELELLRAFQTDVEQRGAEFRIMLIPSLAEIDPPAVFGEIPSDVLLEPLLAHDSLRDFIMSDLKVPLIDVYPRIIEAYSNELVYFPKDGHFNARGYALMGETLCQALGD